MLGALQKNLLTLQAMSTPLCFRGQETMRKASDPCQ